MRSAFLALLVFAGCTTATPPAPASVSAGGDRTLQGTVVAFDLAPMAYDGDGVVTVRTDDGDDVRVLLPARSGLCAAAYDDWSALAAEAPVAVRGAVDAEGAVRPCTSPEHYFRLR